MFLNWRKATGLAWPQAQRALGRLVHWLRYHDPARTEVPDFSRPVRGERRVNCVLAAVREFFRHAASAGLEILSDEDRAQIRNVVTAIRSTRQTVVLDGPGIRPETAAHQDQTSREIPLVVIGYEK